ncbi:uncharacterized protein LOC132302406 [Cornus florida]|uniref:uncharacterized protein LOC132302406 n=1 Tax=Cornus florida TaxID=4283 RepID=UPI00289DB406|nr:uncharacterized protein LOC132302406 [Cornus florida]
MNNGGGGGGGGAAPTGCYKCGRPGHWSRDCPSNPNANTDNPKISSSNIYSNKNASSSSSFKSGGSFNGASNPASEKPKKVPRARPKLTPDLLLSNDGLGYVLRHFPHAFRFRGHQHEVSDLGNLIGLYAEWHSHLLPYYSFEQFVHKVEQVGTTKRVRLCIKELRERVANGGDLTKLHEPPVEQDISNHEQETLDLEKGAPLKNHDTDDLQEDMLQEIYKQATEEPYPSMHDVTFAAESSDNSTVKELPNQAPESAAASSSSPSHISEEQRARMEANRLKALERAAAAAPRSSCLQTA